MKEFAKKVAVSGLRAAPVLLVFGIAIWISAEQGEPDTLPGAALGWDALFHVERASLLLGATGAVLLVGWRAMHGEFPIKFGNLEYAVKDAAAEAEQVAAAQERRLRILEVLNGLRALEDLDDDDGAA